MALSDRAAAAFVRVGQEIKALRNSLFPVGFLIWAEENSNLSTTANAGRQFSYGNGATNQFGPVMPFDVMVRSLTLSCLTATTGTVALVVDEATTNKTVSVSSSKTGTTEAIDHFVTKGSRIAFDTISGSGGGKVVIAAWVERV